MPRQYTARVPFECLHCHGKLMIVPSEHGIRKFCSKHCRDAHSTSQSVDRFWSRVRKDDGCWEWQERIEKTGYGSCYFMGKTWATHRLSWTLTYGPIPDDLWVLHHCDNRACVRPDHLFLGTQADNMRDAAVKGVMKAAARKGRMNHPESWPRGEEHWKAKLTADDIRAIRSATGVSKMELSRRYGVAHVTIRRIIARKAWVHI